MPNSWIRLTLLYLLVTAAAGVLMRSMALVTIPAVHYENILHAHSHLALLGWGYMALFLLFLALFFKESERLKSQIKLLARLTQLTAAGMFIAFCLQGYALFSIILSTIQILLSYWFVILFWRHLRLEASAKRGEKKLSSMFAKGSLICLVVSSIGPWCLAVLSANDLKDSPLYETAIYFYLHFQYNGWFTLGLLAVLLRILENKGIHLANSLTKLQYGLYAGSLLPAFLLSVLWIRMDLIWHMVAAAAGIVQWVATVLLCMILYRVRHQLGTVFHGWAQILFVLAMAIILMKATMELGVIVPELSGMIYHSRSIVIGYLHLVLLGFVSFMCLSLFLQQGWLSQTRRVVQLGYGLFIVFFAVNEGVLFLQGLFEWVGRDTLAYGRQWLWLASVGMMVGIGLFGGSSPIDDKRIA
jgi:hypothetical protein